MSCIYFAAKNISFRRSETYSNVIRTVKILCYSIFCGVTPPPSNCPYSSGEGVVNIVQIWHSDAQPGIVQSSNQIRFHDRRDSHDPSAHKISNLFFYIEGRGLGWPLHGGYFLLLQPYDSSTVVLAGALSCGNTHGWFWSPNMFCVEIEKVSWQCFDIILRIQVFIENDPIAITMVANAHHHYRNVLITIDHA